MADFDDFDDFDFKPVTKGLGFHHQEKKEVKSYKRSTPLENANHREIQRPQPQVPSAPSVSRNDLSSFYADPSPKPVELPSSLRQEQLVYSDTRPALFGLRLIASILDEFVILGLSLITIAGFALLLGARSEAVFALMPWYEIIPFALLIYSLYFISYFTILDPQATLGKGLMHLRLVSLDDVDKVNFVSSFIRAVICLVSPLFLFLPVLLDWQGKASSTFVAKR